ncbi:hypothetical protein PsorP6_000007 [Peronosclerospora sorghi]|uniref:Uncharacterized protein n=1 Tax=Peronosclerospora sorghi TaxID=230839 RepID=A0ACC0WRD6_9STRA|nr:hypothetical protein PsorP6_000007 [Peronosclerospora sorghi]
MFQAKAKLKPDFTCRSAGRLKFDAKTRPMHHIQESVVAKFSSTCQSLTEEMVCSSCHPLMGTWEIRNICPSLCNDWYDACKGEYYAYNGAGTLSPCYGNALICSHLKEIVGSGADFCVQMGFHVGSDADIEGIECFDGSVPETISEVKSFESWRTRLQHILEKEANNPSGLFIAGVFIVITLLLMGGRLMSRFRDPFGGDQLSLMEVRRLQQERYERGDEDDYSSSSNEDRILQLAADDDRDNCIST